MKISIVGMGAGALSSISYGAFQKINNAKHLFLRTKRHPVVAEFEKIDYQSFDYLYEEADDFASAYQQMVDILFEKVAELGEIVYAVPGHPKVAETSVERLLEDERIQKMGIEIEVISSGSFLEEMFVSLGLDPTKKGITLLDALDFEFESLYAHTDLVFTQVFSSYVASELKLTLMEHFKDDIEVVLFKGVGIKDIEQKITVPLYQIDQCGFVFDHLSSIFISYSKENYRYKTVFDLMETIKILRSDGGCPWDREQNPTTLIPFLKEETQELVEAIQKDDIDNMIEEMGDVLNILAMLARMGEEAEYFNLFDVFDAITQKLIFRHPHIFLNPQKLSVEEVNLLWEEQKKKEKQNKV